MQLLAIILASNNPPFQDSPTILAKAYRLPRIGMLKKKAIKDMCKFLGRTMPSATQPSTRSSFSHEEYMAHVYHRSDGIICTAITDAEYPSRILFPLLRRTIEIFCERFGEEWKSPSLKKDKGFRFRELDDMIVDYQDPNRHDAVARAMEATERTIQNLTQSIQQVMVRGESIDRLAAKSEDMSKAAAVFYKDSKKVKRCCIII